MFPQIPTMGRITSAKLRYRTGGTFAQDESRADYWIDVKTVSGEISLTLCGEEVRRIASMGYDVERWSMPRAFTLQEPIYASFVHDGKDWHLFEVFSNEDRQPVMKPVDNPCIPANGVKVGMKLNHRKTAAGSIVLEVLSITPVFGGNLSFKCKGFSVQGDEFHPSVTYRPDQEVEVIHERTS